MAAASSNVPVLCGACGKAAAPRRAKFPWIAVVGIGWITGALGGLGIALYHLRHRDAVCGHCGKRGPFGQAPPNAEVVASRRVVRPGAIIAVLAFVAIIVYFAIVALMEGIALEEATGVTDDSYAWTFLFFWVGVPLVAVMIAAGGRSKRVKEIERLQGAGASLAQPVAPPMPAATNAPRAVTASPAAGPIPPSAYDQLPRLELLAQRHPSLAELPRLREWANAGHGAAVAARLTEIESKLAERARLLRNAQESARKLGKLSERLADGELSESAFQSAKAHIERDAAATDELLRALDAELFREEFEKPI